MRGGLPWTLTVNLPPAQRHGCDRLVQRLLQGPATDAELNQIVDHGFAKNYVKTLNDRLEGSRWHVFGKWVAQQTKFGMVKVRLYELVRQQ